MRYLFVIGILFFASSCLSPAEQAKREQMRAQADHEECLSLGFKPDTPEYGDCRLRLKEMRINANRPVYYPYVGVGYHHRYHHW